MAHRVWGAALPDQRLERTRWDKARLPWEPTEKLARQELGAVVANRADGLIPELGAAVEVSEFDADHYLVAEREDDVGRRAKATAEIVPSRSCRAGLFETAEFQPCVERIDDQQGTSPRLYLLL